MEGGREREKERKGRKVGEGKGGGGIARENKTDKRRQNKRERGR